MLRYQTPSLWRAIWQITNSFGLYALSWYMAYVTLIDSIWLSMFFATFASGMLIRIFIIFHDCGHGSFFKSKKANDVIGFITGALTLTPYYHWRWEHSVHHATSGNLDKRGVALAALQISGRPQPYRHFRDRSGAFVHDLPALSG